MTNWKDEVSRRLAPLRLPPVRETEIASELAQHLDDRCRELEAGGLSRADAEREALSEIDQPNVMSALAVIEPAESSSAPLGGSGEERWYADLAGDVRYALRAMRKSPGFALTVILTLALGIGANAAIFSVVNAVLLRPLPFPSPDNLVRLFHTYPYVPRGIEGLSPADLFALRDGATSFEAVATYRVPNDAFALVEGDRPETVYGTFVTADFFKVLGVAPILGTTFTHQDENPASPLKVVVSYGFWQRRLHGDPNAVGTMLRLAGLSVPVVGVMPQGFWFPRSDRAELWAIERMAPPSRQGPWFFSGIGRLRGGVTAAQAQPDLDRAAQTVRRTFPQGALDFTIVTRPLKTELVGDMSQVLVMLLAAVALVLVIACVNITNLMLARATGREREIAIRMALGASRVRVVRQLITETLLFASIGAAAGLVLARWGVEALVALTPRNLQILHDASIQTDWRVVAAAAAIAVGAALVFGLAPAFASSMWNVGRIVNESGRGTTETPGRRRARAALVVAEVTMSVVVLVGAGLVTRSLIRLQNVNPGIRSEGLLTTTLTTPPSRYQQQQSVDAFYERLLTDVRAVPGVEAATVTDGVPPAGPVSSSNFIVEGERPADGQAEPIGDVINIDGDYFRVTGIPLVAGRTFDARDMTPTSPNTVIINEGLARRFFASRGAIGRQLRVSGDWVATIVGIVGNAKYDGLDGVDELTMYAPTVGGPRTRTLVVKAAGDPSSALPAVRSAIARIDPEIPLGRTRTMEELMADSVERPRFRTVLLALFGVAALALAAVGVYGVMIYSVSRRTREMGIRMALGARAGDVRRLVVREGVTLAAAGVIIGCIASLALSRLIADLLFGVTPRDPITFAAVAALLVGVAFVATWLPARRATRVDPLVALRAE